MFGKCREEHGPAIPAADKKWQTASRETGKLIRGIIFWLTFSGCLQMTSRTVSKFAKK
jgi:hypothetical protein